MRFASFEQMKDRARHEIVEKLIAAESLAHRRGGASLPRFLAIKPVIGGGIQLKFVSCWCGDVRNIVGYRQFHPYEIDAALYAELLDRAKELGTAPVQRSSVKCRVAYSELESCPSPLKASAAL